MKFLIIGLSVLALIVLAYSKVITVEEVKQLENDAVVKIQEVVENVTAQRNAILESLARDGLVIPVITHTCIEEACLYICNRLGFPNGACLTSSPSCQCSA